MERLSFVNLIELVWTAIDFNRRIKRDVAMVLWKPISPFHVAKALELTG
ncbi:MAG: hypothetical protein ACTS7I_01030 [Candidatus Hodgkinia cicadicola]